MSRSHRVHTLIAMGILLLSRPAAAVDAPLQTNCMPAPLPSQTTVSVIGTEVEVNGLPLSIFEARNAMPVDDFLGYFRDLWTDRSHAKARPMYVEYDLKGWHVIAHPEGNCFYTVQVHPHQPHTDSLVGVGTPGQLRPAAASAMPDIELPGGARPLSHMTSQDIGKLGDSWVIKSDNSVLETVRFFRETLQSNGWQMISHREPASSNQTAMLMLQKGARDVGIVVQPAARGSTLVLTMQIRQRPSP